MTSISVLFCSTDSNYCHKVGEYLGKHHSNVKISIVHSMPKSGDISTIGAYNIILIDEEFADIALNLSYGAAVAYLSMTESRNTVNGKKCFCKYRSGETIYKYILTLFSEVSSSSSLINGNSNVISFMDASGGAGATTAAVGLAMLLAGQGKNVLYFNLDKLSNTSAFFSSNTGIGTLSELISDTLLSTSKVSNMTARAESLIVSDASGVKFINDCRLGCDFDELDKEGLEKIFKAVVGSEKFDNIILDSNIYDSNAFSLIMNNAECICLMAEDSVVSNGKLLRTLETFKAYSARQGKNLVDITHIIFNKVVDEKRIEDWRGKSYEGYAVLGGIKKYNSSNPKDIASAASRLPFWEGIIGGAND